MPAQFLSLRGRYGIQDGPLNGLGAGIGVRYQGNTITDDVDEHTTANDTLVDAQAQ